MHHMVQRTLDEIGYRSAGLAYQARHRTDSKPRILVNGSPKTGTTWMKLMLASVPGFEQGINFNGQIERYTRAKAGHIYHGHDRLTSELDALLVERGFRVVVTLRDPRDQLVSRMFHVRRDKRHAWHDHVNDWSDDEILMACIEGGDSNSFPGIVALHNITRTWLTRPELAVLVRYEDLLQDANAEMVGVFDHLGLHIGAALRRAIVSRNQFDRLTVGKQVWRRGRKRGEMDVNSHFRKGVRGDWRRYFQPAHIERFKSLANDILVQFGYEDDDTWS